MAQDRVTELRVRGLRTLANIRLPLSGLTVLIGNNGTGKSSVIEALEILRKAAQPGNFVNLLGVLHGGLEELLRVGSSELFLGLRIEGNGAPIDYSFAIAREGSSARIVSEELNVRPDPNRTESLRAISRDRSGCRVFDPSSQKLSPLELDAGRLALTAFGEVAQPAIKRVNEALERGRVHVPFDVRPTWVALGSEKGDRAGTRDVARLEPADDLARLGANLANCFHRLNQSGPEIQKRVLTRVQEGLGPEVSAITAPAVGGGRFQLRVHFRGVESPLPASTLSDGQLAYLAFVAITELEATRSFMAFDEPESHLHPAILVRVVWMLEELAENCPVLVSTQSDRLLDALSEPAKSAVLCELDEGHSTRFLRPDPDKLELWLAKYRGLGELRAEGYERHVISKPVEVER